MKISKYLSKERFSMKQVAGLLAIVFTGIAVLVYGAVTIPNTFTSGTTAKSSEVNANFQALANAMPAAKTTQLGFVTITKDISAGTGGQELLSLPVTLPAPGNVILNATGFICVPGHNTSGTLNLKISKTSGDADFGTKAASISYKIITTYDSQNFPDSNFCAPFSLNGMLSEPSAGPTTYYLNGITVNKGSGATQEVDAVTFTALYVPNSL